MIELICIIVGAAGVIVLAAFCAMNRPEADLTQERLDDRKDPHDRRL